jgi:hypothetical protein
MIRANYNAAHRMRSHHWFRGCLTGLLLLCALSIVAQEWNAPAAEFARAIVTATGSGTVKLSLTNASSIPADQVSAVQSAIEAQLSLRNVRITSSGENEVRITLSENVNQYVWVAEIRKGAETQVQMITVPRTQVASATEGAPNLTVRKVLLWSQPVQVLDVLLLDPGSANPRMAVLDAGSLSIYSLREGKWQRDQNWAIAHSHPFPRDLRGLLAEEQNHSVTAYLPGTVCNASVNSIVCHDSDDAWKIGPQAAFFNSARNYFTGVLVPASDKAAGPFYSMAWLQEQNYHLIVWTGIDGVVHATDGINERVFPSRVTSDWGSDLAAVTSHCGVGSQLLVTSAGDDNSLDSLRAYEIPNRDPLLVSHATDFPGPILAIWSHEPSRANVIVHNRQTGQYEAYSVSIACTQ